jgi:large subunit ribosomal protein L1
MTDISKRKKFNLEIAAPLKDRVVSLSEALAALRSMKSAKFVEAMDMVISFKKKKTKSKVVDTVRGSTILPQGSGKNFKIAAIVTTQAEADLAMASGAFCAGGESLIKQIQEQNGVTPFEFEYCVTTHAGMGLVARIAKILGPRNMMPSMKNGTVSSDIGTLVKNMKTGHMISYKSERSGGSIHFRVGPMSFSDQALIDNFKAIISHITSTQDAQSIQSVHVKTTMSPVLMVKIG